MAASDHISRDQIEICEGCGTTSSMSNSVEGGICEDCFSEMPMDEWTTPIMASGDEKVKWVSSQEHGEDYLARH
jgi:hypothetical protein